MAVVRFTRNLLRFYPDLQVVDLPAQNIKELMVSLEKRFPGLSSYFIDDQGSLREHVNIFIGNTLINDRKYLSDQIGPNEVVYIMQALSGG